MMADERGCVSLLVWCGVMEMKEVCGYVRVEVMVNKLSGCSPTVSVSFSVYSFE